MKTIPLEQLSIYLPHKLKGVLTCSHEDDFYNQDWADLSKFQQGCIWQLAGYTDPDLNVPLGEGEYTGLLWRDENTYVCFHSGIKPILHPLSKFKDINSESMNNLGIDLQDQICINELANGWISAFNMPFSIIQIMAKNHIDIFNWTGQGLAEPIK